MARRALQCTEIVPENENMTISEIRAENWRYDDLVLQTQTTEAALKWCARRRLVANDMPCGTCNKLCPLVNQGRSIDKKRWKCSPCGFKRTVRDCTFFTHSHLTLQQILKMMYYWSHDLPQKLIAHETGINSKSITVWCNFMREECDHWLKGNAAKLGGIDANGEAIIVEIAEFKNYRKFSKIRCSEDHWVFGGVERGTSKCFLVEVEDRKPETLMELLQCHILPASHIISDDCKMFLNIAELTGGVYQHTVMINKQLVHPKDGGLHTQTIKNMGMLAERKIRHQFGTSHFLFRSYLSEFVFRNHFRNHQIFPSFIAAVAENYLH